VTVFFDRQLADKKKEKKKNEENREMVISASCGAGETVTGREGKGGEKRRKERERVVGRSSWHVRFPRQENRKERKSRGAQQLRPLGLEEGKGEKERGGKEAAPSLPVSVRK